MAFGEYGNFSDVIQAAARNKYDLVKPGVKKWQLQVDGTRRNSSVDSNLPSMDREK